MWSFVSELDTESIDDDICVHKCSQLYTMYDFLVKDGNIIFAIECQCCISFTTYLYGCTSSLLSIIVPF